MVIGKDGWLFTDEEFKPAPTQQQLDDNWALVRGVQQELERRGVKLVLAIIPAKTRLYPEFVGKEQPAALHASLYSDFLQRARQAGMAAPELLGTLEKAKDNGQVFLRTDTHWTPLGAEAVAQRLGESIRQARVPTCRPRPSSPRPARAARTRATCSPSCRWTRCSPTCCRPKTSWNSARPTRPTTPRRHPKVAATCSATAPSRRSPWSAPATAPTRAGTSLAR